MKNLPIKANDLLWRVERRGEAAAPRVSINWRVQRKAGKPADAAGKSAITDDIASYEVS